MQKKDAGADFAKLAKAFVVEKNIEWDRTETASSTTVTFTNLTLGYYLVDTSLGVSVQSEHNGAECYHKRKEQ